MKTVKLIILLLAASLVIPTLCACGDDDDDLLVINGINIEGIWAYGYNDKDFDRIDVLYKFSKDGLGIAYIYVEREYPLVNGIMQCAFSDFKEELRATWTVKDKTISIAGFALTITKVISHDEAEAINWWGDKIIIRRVKGFAK